jgi:hypothetical protein
MNSTFSLGRLTASLPKVGLPTIIVRHGSKKPRPDPKSIKPKTPPPPFDPTYGEKIYVFQHTRANHVIYSHTKVIKANKALRQIPFNGKKLRPTTIRKDYWRPMALIKFADGAGEVGRSVFQKLREFRKRHELEWEEPEVKQMDKKERGKWLNDQKGNTVADMAAVLGGAGKGNKIWVSEEAEQKAKGLRPADESVIEQVKDSVVETAKKVVEPITEGEATEKKESAVGAKDGLLHEATIYWVNELDADFAESWPANVTHVEGLDGTIVQAVEDEVASKTTTPEKEQAAANTEATA